MNPPGRYLSPATAQLVRVETDELAEHEGINRGTATAGEFGVIAIEYYDTANDVYRKRIGTIGEDGLEPNVAYKLDGDNKFVRAK